MKDEQVVCPQCRSEDVEEGSLSRIDSARPVLFGGKLLRKMEMWDYGC
jgi:hypothetical protein